MYFTKDSQGIKTQKDKTRPMKIKIGIIGKYAMPAPKRKVLKDGRSMKREVWVVC